MPLTIIEYEPRYFEDFRQMNLEWLEFYGLLEAHDMEMLNDPEGVILDAGGAIFLAALDGAVVGSAALVPMHDTEEGYYELAKMYVAPACRGKGISKLLIEKCLDKAREIGAGKIILYSNSQLQTAISLYTRYGFQHVPVTDSPFETADIKMELQL